MVQRGWSIGQRRAMILLLLATLGLGAEAHAKAPAGRYVVSGDAKVVTDAWTKLAWQREVVAGKKSWNDAKGYCQQLTLAGQSDWRLPWVRELQGIVDYKEVNPSIDKDAFPSTPAYYFWSASLRAGNPSHAWSVYFYYGYVYYRDISNTYVVRCVRGS